MTVAQHGKAFMVGSGGHAQMLRQLIAGDAQASVSLVAWLETADYTGPHELLGLPVFTQDPAGFQSLRALGATAFYFGVGMIKAAPWREGLYSMLCEEGFSGLSYQHPSALVDASATIGLGSFIGVGAIVQPFAEIGQACLVNTGSIIEHHVVLEQNVHIGPGAVVCGQARIGAHSLLGARSVVLQQLHIGKNATIGAGSVVLESVPDDATAVGQPAQCVLRQD
jgi:sugar O-acyltransferase (sialic acid O-acetyltransferase NeuD family)